MRLFLEARVRHVAMSILDHCLLMLSLTHKQPKKQGRKHFFFEAMWTRDERCREIVKGAWDLGWIDLENGIIGRLKRCQEQLQSWNWAEFGNVNKMLREREREKLQQLELWDSLHGKTEEIKRVIREINKIQVREEIM